MFFFNKKFLSFIGSIVNFLRGNATKNDVIHATSQLSNIEKKILQYFLYFCLLIVSIYILHNNPKYIPDFVLQNIEKLSNPFNIIDLITEPKLLVKPNKYGTKNGYSIGKLHGRRDFQWNTKL